MAQYEDIRSNSTYDDISSTTRSYAAHSTTATPRRAVHSDTVWGKIKGEGAKFHAYLKKRAKSYSLFKFYYFALLWLEIVFRICAKEQFFTSGLFFIPIFILPAAILLNLLSSFFSEKINRIIGLISFGFVTLLFLVQTVYHTIFTTYLTVYIASTQGEAIQAQYFDLIMSGVRNSVIPLILLPLPFIFLAIIGRRKFFSDAKETHRKAFMIFMLIFTHLFAMFTLIFSGTDFGSARNLYFDTSNIQLSVNRLGVLTTMRIDFKRLLFGFKGKTTTFDESPVTSEVTPATAVQEAPKIYAPNVTNIDFAALAAATDNSELKEMHEYFGKVEPSLKNEKTGLFKGDNLIMVTAEAFAPYAISKELTPTLYKMQQEGYNFTNFYNPLWSGSTLAGEFAVNSGLLPMYEDGVLSFRKMAKNNFYYAMGNQLKRAGYLTTAFHANTYNYYDRDETHTAMGYDYYGKGGGFDVPSKNLWPQSDVELIDLSWPFFADKGKPFNTYYMTVSGHCDYTWDANAMSAKHRDAVEHMDLSETAKGYLACNIELDKAMELLLQKLETAGIAEKTVIMITPDHYPYELDDNAINELVGHEIDRTYELYKSVFMIYKKGMTPEVIDKPCSDADILPTLSNLFDTGYDSRLMSGRDVFSTAEPIVFFMGRKWITDKASYDPASKKLVSTGDVPVDEAYKERINGIVSNRFTYAEKILDRDYYNILFGGE